MQVFDVFVKNIDQSLTLSDAVAILADQVSAAADSHLHMHARDGFAPYINPSLVSGPPSFVQGPETAIQYEEAHMTTPVRASNQGVPTWNGTGPYPSDRFHVDERRMAKPLGSGTRSSYDMRSNLPAIPGVAGTGKLCGFAQIKDTVPPFAKTDIDLEPFGLAPISVPSQKSDSYSVTQKAKSLGLPTEFSALGLPPGCIKSKNDTNKVAVVYKYKTDIPAVEAISGSEKHTMFEDSEVMAMYLCAALNSSAGFEMLHVLVNKARGDTKTVGIFSKTAVRQVEMHIGRVNKLTKKKHSLPKAIERVTNTDPLIVRTAHYSNPVIDSFTHTPKAIDHIVLVMGKRIDGNLNILTFYPSAEATQVGMGPANVNTGQIDLVEPVFLAGTKRIKMDLKKMNMKW